MSMEEKRRLWFLYAVRQLSWRLSKKGDHEYIVRTTVDEKTYRTLFRILLMDAKPKRWFDGRVYWYYEPGDGRKYWAMTRREEESCIINRCKIWEKQNDGMGVG